MLDPDHPRNRCDYDHSIIDNDTNTMKLYTYSDTTKEFIAAPWVTIGYITAGMVAGTIIFFVILFLNPPAENLFRSESVNALKNENTILHQQLIHMTLQTRRAELRVQMLHDQSRMLDKLMYRTMKKPDSVVVPNEEAILFKRQSQLLVSKTSAP